MIKHQSAYIYIPKDMEKLTMKFDYNESKSTKVLGDLLWIIIVDSYLQVI